MGVTTSTPPPPIDPINPTPPPPPPGMMANMLKRLRDDDGSSSGGEAEPPAGRLRAVGMAMAVLQAEVGDGRDGETFDADTEAVELGGCTTTTTTTITTYPTSPIAYQTSSNLSTTTAYTPSTPNLAASLAHFLATTTGSSSSSSSTDRAEGEKSPLSYRDQLDMYYSPPCSFEQTMQNFLRHLPFEAVDIWVPVFSSPSGTCRLHFGGGTASNPELSQWIYYSKNFQFEPNQGMPGRVFSTGNPEFRDDVARLTNDVFLRRVSSSRSSSRRSSRSSPNR